MNIPFIVMGLILLVFMFSGMPLAFVMLFSSLSYLILAGHNIFVLVNQMFTGIDIFTIMAIPFFMLAGELMVYSGTGNKLLNLANLLVGNYRGGLGYVNVIASMLFGGCSGSALADIGGIGRMEIDMMTRGGYDRDFSAGITVSSSVQGPIIPPSIPLVLIGAATGTSIGGLLLGGAIPGVMIGLSQFIFVYFITKRRGYPVNKTHYTLKESLKIIINSLPFLLLPFIILGGILTGVFTPTEAAAVAAFYGLFLIFVFKRKDIQVKELYHIFKRAAITSAALLLLASASNVFSWVLSIEGVPGMISNFLLSLTENVYLIFFIINIFLLIWGMVMDMLPAILILAPVLFPIMTNLGVDPIHFGVVMALNLSLGLITPPYGQAIFTGVIVSGRPMEKITKEVFPFLLGGIIVLFIITYFPAIVMFIPRLYFN